MKKVKFDNRKIKKQLIEMPINSEIWISGKEEHHIMKFQKDQFYYVKNKTVLDEYLDLKKLLQIIRKNEKW